MSQGLTRWCKLQECVVTPCVHSSIVKDPCQSLTTSSMVKPRKTIKVNLESLTKCHSPIYIYIYIYLTQKSF